MSMYITHKKLSIIIVCYNDGGSVREMYRRVTAVMKKITPNYEIIYVNDASPDNAYDVLREIAMHDMKFIVITHSRNFGGQNAYTSGLRYCTGDAAITLDGDIQDPPELFPKLVKKWLEGYDVVYGIREKRRGVSALLNFSFKLFYRIFRHLSYVSMPLNASDFALIDRKVIDGICAMPETDRIYRGMRAWVGYRQIGIPYERLPRFHGSGSGNFLSYFYWARKSIVSFSYKPIHYILYLGIFFFFFSLLLLIVLFGVIIFYPTFPKQFLGIAVLFFFLTSIQLLAIAILGEYILLITDEVKHRPNYFIKEIINDYKHKIKR